MWKSGSRGALLIPLLLGAALLTACGLLPSNQAPEVPTESYTVTVQPGQSIQEAIDAAPAGAVIRLGEGEWEENLEITKDLTLKGAGPGKTVIKNPRSRDTPGILIRYGAEVRIEGVTVCGVTGSCEVDPEGWASRDGKLLPKVPPDHPGPPPPPAAVEIYGDTVIENSSILRSPGAGIEVHRGAILDIEDSKVMENVADGIWASGPVIIRYSSITDNAGNGIVASSDVYIEGPLYLEGSTVTGNEGSGVLYTVVVGFDVITHAVLKLMGNTISANNGSGVEVHITMPPPAPAVPAVVFPHATADVHMSLESNAITDNGAYGVDCKEIIESENVRFTGEIRGRANTIRGNAAEDIRPWLRFLITSEGGCYGPGCEADQN